MQVSESVLTSSFDFNSQVWNRSLVIEITTCVLGLIITDFTYANLVIYYVCSSNFIADIKAQILKYHF